MDEKDLKLLLDDLCMRLPYGVIYHRNDGAKKKLMLVDIIQCNLNYTDNIVERDCMPYLRPLSSMTDEEKNELDLIIDKCNKKVFTCPKEERKYNFFDMEQVHFYLSHHFDINELILKKLAIEAPEGLYKI